MERINLDAVPQEALTGHTSKGDQPKWQVKEKWYKADHMGYEALSEIIVCQLLTRSNVHDFVLYRPVMIDYQGRELRGCESENFRKKGEMLVPLERLHRAHEGQGLAQTLGRMTEPKERLQYTVNFVERVTGLSDVGQYLTTLLELDAFFLNEDRHTNNLAVIRGEDGGKFRLCPIFDNGLALLSDLHDYPEDADIYTCIGAVQAKPFARTFDEQVEAANDLYGSYLKLSFHKKDVTELLKSLQGFYSEGLLRRVEGIIFEQMRRYGIYF